MFLLDQIVLQQGSSGVPIGGFLGAQLAELWALWKEVLALGGGTPSSSTECTWNIALRRDCTKVCTGTIGINPVPFPCPDISGPLKFSESRLLNLPDDSPVATAAIWEPVDSRVASVYLGDIEIPIVVTAPWDGSSGGRTHTILRFTPIHSRAAAHTFLKGYEVFRDVVNEFLHPQPQIHGDCPRILLSRYRDTIYIMFTDIPPMLEHDARIAIRSFQAAVYGIELQWEMHSEITTLGEGQVHCSNDRLRLTRKGTVLHHGTSLSNATDGWM